MICPESCVLILLRTGVQYAGPESRYSFSGIHHQNLSGPCYAALYTDQYNLRLFGSRVLTSASLHLSAYLAELSISYCGLGDDSDCQAQICGSIYLKACSPFRSSSTYAVVRPLILFLSPFPLPFPIVFIWPLAHSHTHLLASPFQVRLPPYTCPLHSWIPPFPGLFHLPHVFVDASLRSSFVLIHC